MLIQRDQINAYTNGPLNEVQKSSYSKCKNIMTCKWFDHLANQRTQKKIILVRKLESPANIYIYIDQAGVELKQIPGKRKKPKESCE